MHESWGSKQDSGPARHGNALNVICEQNVYFFDVFNIFCVESSVKEFESIREDYMQCRDKEVIDVENIFNKPLYRASKAP